MKSKMAARAAARSAQKGVPLSSLRTAPEAFRGSVVEAAPGSAHALLVPQLDYYVAELTGGVFRSAIAVDQAAGFQAAQCLGHVQGVDDRLGAMVIGHRVADDLAVARSSHEAR